MKAKGYFGEFGGTYVPETLMPALRELNNAFQIHVKSKAFQREFVRYLFDYVGRPTPLYYAANISGKTGMNLYLKK